MKIVDVDQNTLAWHEWRNSGFSASEAPAVMGESAYFPATPYQLYLVHTGQRAVHYNNSMRDGHFYENQIVEWACGHTGLDFKAACVQKGQFLASLDGLAMVDGKAHVLEVKTTKIDSKIWNDGRNIYKWQLTHQALVTGVDVVYFAVYAKDADAYKLDLIQIADEDKEALIKAWDKFEEAMTNFKPPELIPGKDYVIDESEKFTDAASRYLKLSEDKKQIEKEIAAVKTELMRLADGKAVKGGGISIYEVTRKGAIDYTRIRELDNVDLEPYRKDATSYWVIK